MRKLLAALLLVLSLHTQLYAATVTDSWTGVGDSTDIGANWDNNYFNEGRNCQVVGERVRGANNTVCYESWNANSFSGDQSGQITLVTWQAADGSASILLKASDPASSTNFYRCVALTTGGAQIRKIVDGSSSILSTVLGVVWSPGDELKCTIVSNNITLYQNGFTRVAYTDTSSLLTGTRIGISVFGGVNENEIEIDDFIGEDIGGGPPPGGNRQQVVVIE